MDSKNKLNFTINNLLRKAEYKRLNINLPTDDILEQYFYKLNLRISEEFRIFLKEANNIFYGTCSLLFIIDNSEDGGSLAEAYLYMQKNGAKKNWIPFCEDNGNYFYIDENDKVFYWSHDGISNESWNSLTDWINEVWICSYNE